MSNPEVPTINPNKIAQAVAMFLLSEGQKIVRHEHAMKDSRVDFITIVSVDGHPVGVASDHGSVASAATALEWCAGVMRSTDGEGRIYTYSAADGVVPVPPKGEAH